MLSRSFYYILVGVVSVSELTDVDSGDFLHYFFLYLDSKYNWEFNSQFLSWLINDNPMKPRSGSIERRKSFEKSYQRRSQSREGRSKSKGRIEVQDEHPGDYIPISQAKKTLEKKVKRASKKRM